MTDHLGHVKQASAGVGTGNIRNSRRPKTGLTERGGEVQIDVPRDRAATVEPQVVRTAPSRSPGSKPASRNHRDSFPRYPARIRRTSA
jgi:transposase-like protein